MANHYADAIDFFSSEPSCNQIKNVLIWIAKKHPKTVVDAVKATDPEPKWKRSVAQYLEAEQFINAIKEHRLLTGAGLKESKEICESFRDSGEYRRYL